MHVVVVVVVERFARSGRETVPRRRRRQRAWSIFRDPILFAAAGESRRRPELKARRENSIARFSTDTLALPVGFDPQVGMILPLRDLQVG
jgi:hypothetical protein